MILPQMGFLEDISTRIELPEFVQRLLDALELNLASSDDEETYLELLATLKKKSAFLRQKAKL